MHHFRVWHYFPSRLRYVAFILFVLAASALLFVSLQRSDRWRRKSMPPTAGCDLLSLPSLRGDPSSLVLNELDETDFTFALIGDEGVGTNSRRVLQLVEREGAELLLSAGDLAYKHASSTEWDAQLNSVLGDAFPYFAAIGNHDIGRWRNEFEPLLTSRAGRNGMAAGCAGNLGIASVCVLRGILVVFSSIGTLCNHSFDHTAFVTRTLEDPQLSKAPWKICLFHKNQRLMQRGNKADATGWGVYESCRRAGAIIVTGHDHGYARTHLMSEFASVPEYIPSSMADELLELSPQLGSSNSVSGRTVSILTGLGGKDVRPTADRLGDAPWYASSLSEGDLNAAPGAVVCRMIERRRKTVCVFKTINGVVVDRFTLATSLLATR